MAEFCHTVNITEELAEKAFEGLCFINLVDFDMNYGHRQDTDGYAAALSRFDAWLGGFLNKLNDEDMLIITADHGCDPADNSTDHTRECVPLIVYGGSKKAQNLGTLSGFYAISEIVCDYLGVDFTPDGDIHGKII